MYIILKRLRLRYNFISVRRTILLVVFRFSFFNQMLAVKTREQITVSLIFVDVLVVMDWFEDTELLPCTLDVMAVRLVMTVGAGLK